MNTKARLFVAGLRSSHYYFTCIEAIDQGMAYEPFTGEDLAKLEKYSLLLSRAAQLEMQPEILL